MAGTMISAIVAVAAASTLLSTAVTSAAASTIEAPTAVSTGGMTAASTEAEAVPSTRMADPPSCLTITYPGPSGVITVQNTNGRVAWGINMHDPADSIGRWDVDTLINGEKGVSGFHRTTTGPYIPHGAPLVPSGARFSVDATVVNPDGETHRSVTNECIVP